MVAKEGTSLLPTTSCSVKNVKAGKGRFPIKRALFWLHMTTLVFIFCWLAFLTCRSFGPEAPPVLTADAIRQLMANEEVRLDSIAVSLFTNSETAAATPLRVMQNF